VTAAGVHLGSIYCASGHAASFAGREWKNASRDRQVVDWQLVQTRPILESDALERIEEKLEQLGGGKVTRIFGDEGDDRPPLISH
jgi:hypothetical protein